ncbi:MAG: glucose-6-phosphate isomerase [Elusimicrobium sp.]|uniref:Glucose-6-phosphate isomerase n=1 Tax=Candidatus Avelusimicrobium gallicola TaxID=2562704 RepID=A0A928DQW4_9BACT|nr:glucose-6-phosphate isomerase [Elusimicrobium sp.]
MNTQATPIAEGIIREGEIKLEGLEFNTKFWAKDPTLWKQDKEHMEFIVKFLGWQKVYDWTLERIEDVTTFANDVKQNFKHCVIMGMGGSSLAPEVFRTVFGKQNGWPELIVLDTTNPDWVGAARARINPAETLFIFASKSGGTVEPSSQFAYFFDEVKKAGVKEPGKNFAAITDPGTGLEALAKKHNFRKTFLNPADIGGRFSALSMFGIVPAAIMGVDVTKLLTVAKEQAATFSAEAPVKDNAAVKLGAFMGACNVNHGRDKMTLLTPCDFATFGLWAEQLVAESTGKEGKGIVPVAGESLTKNFDYRDDRYFVYLSTGSDDDKRVSAIVKDLAERGYPILTIVLENKYQLGAMFLLWEIATAAAGAILAIDPFDQPNVQEAKTMTKNILAKLEAGDIPAEVSAPLLVSKDIAGEVKLETLSQDLYSLLESNDYVAILPYVYPSEEVDQALLGLRDKIMTRTKRAVLFGYGPRYLHSTGQLHKGDGNNGVFLLLSAEPAADIKIPGQQYTFGQLCNAQALGDFQALESKGRRVIKIHLTQPLTESIKKISDLF